MSAAIRSPIRVYAMARPSRPPMEAALVAAATGHMQGSARSRARWLARQVASAALRDVDADDVQSQLARLGLNLGASPVEMLALHPDIDTARLIQDERARRLQQRGYRHLPEREWETENQAIIDAVAAILCGRYERHMRKCA